MERSGGRLNYKLCKGNPTKLRNMGAQSFKSHIKSYKNTRTE